MKPEFAGAVAAVPATVSRRSLSTARAVLRVLSLLLASPSGVSAEEVAGALGKSTSTAYYLLASLCNEGFAVHEARGVYRAARGLAELSSVAERESSLHPGLAGTVDELFLLTRKRSYLGVVHSGCIEIVAFHGRQGVPRMPGLGTEIRENAHALAMGKIVLSLLGAAGLARYVSRGLKTYTPHTIVTRDGLDAELERVRHDGYAVDREEFDENFCCVAAPIFDPRGHFVAALGLSTTPNVFDTQRDRLAKTVMQIAAGATAEAPIKPGRVAPHSRLTPVRGHGSPSRRELASRYEKHELLAPKRSEI